MHVAIIGRVATADMAMVFFVTLAVWSGWELTRPENPARKIWWWIFYVTLALGFLAKGPVAWLPFGGMILGRVFLKNSFRLPLIETVVGLCVASALAALWGIPALAQTNGQFFTVGIGEHVVRRSTGIIDSHGLQLRGTPGCAGFPAAGTSSLDLPGKQRCSEPDFGKEQKDSHVETKCGKTRNSKDDLKSLPMAEVEKRLGSSPDGLSQAEAQKRLTQYGPNEIEEKKTNPFLKFLTYFWGPIPG